MDLLVALRLKISGSGLLLILKPFIIYSVNEFADQSRKSAPQGRFYRQPEQRLSTFPPAVFFF
ncbi:MAG: hypothetical protein LBS65_10270 [Desulfovibrio sp.]|jgi:hypothetical protein|nr:hypothetical protein [Desulfovibrio sp.]